MFKPILACSVSLLILTSAAGAAEQGTYIEQVVIKEAIAGQPAMRGKEKIWLTSTHIRHEIAFDENSSVSIFDLEGKRVYLIPSEEKQYIELSLDAYQRIVAMRLSGAGLNDPEANPRLEKTSEQKKIKEWPCTKYLFEQGGKIAVKSELWVSKETGVDFQFYMELMKKLGTEKMLGRLSEFVSRIDGYPVEVRTEQTQEGQTVISSHLVVKIAKGPVDPALFKVPAGCKRIEGGSLDVENSGKGGQ